MLRILIQILAIFVASTHCLLQDRREVHYHYHFESSSSNGYASASLAPKYPNYRRMLLTCYEQASIDHDLCTTNAKIDDSARRRDDQLLICENAYALNRDTCLRKHRKLTLGNASSLRRNLKENKTSERVLSQL